MRSVWAAIAALLLCTAGCATTRATVTRDVYDGTFHYVRLAELYPDGSETPVTFDHPVDFTASDVFYVLEQFEASTKSGRTYTDTRSVFPRQIARLLAPHIAKAFNEATSTEYVTFKFTQRVPGFLLPKNVITTGSMFVAEDEFHLAIEHFEAEPEQVERISYRPDRTAITTYSRIETGEHTRRVSDPETGRIYEHWVATDWAALQAKLQARRLAEARRRAARERRQREGDAGAPQDDWELFEGEPIAVEEGEFDLEEPGAPAPEP